MKKRRDEIAPPRARCLNSCFRISGVGSLLNVTEAARGGSRPGPNGREGESQRRRKREGDVAFALVPNNGNKMGKIRAAADNGL